MADSKMCHSALFSFRGDLEGLLVRQYRDGPVVYKFHEYPAIKDPIEAMGIPHTEVDVILVNGISVAFGYQLQNNDKVTVFPANFHCEARNDIIHLACKPERPVKFILDVHLGKLARRLRLLGFDCLYRNDYDDAEIINISHETGRIILTRDLGILKHRCVTCGYLVRHDHVDNQVEEVLTRFGLKDQLDPFSRCLKCNGLMESVKKDQIASRLEVKTRLYYEDFHRCSQCDALYWQGSHYEKILQWLGPFM